jgi:hypothetical protein
MKAFSVVLLPVHCDAPLHWTVLVLYTELETGAILSVKYYDWCSGLKESRMLAQRLLSLLSFSEADATVEPMQLPTHCNHYRQKPKSNDCGFAAWHAMENVCKAIRKEPVGVFPRPEAWRKMLKTFMEGLQKEQDKWTMEQATGGKAKHPVCLPGMKKIGSEAAPLKLFANQFFTCSSCRWRPSGQGCCYCNPESHEKLKLLKEKRSREMQIALQKALKTCKSLGLIGDVAAPEDVKKLQGGSPNGIHRAIYALGIAIWCKSFSLGQVLLSEKKNIYI